MVVAHRRRSTDASRMEVLVIGAGIAGLSCARRLIAKGHTVTVVDKGRGVGGRLATRRLGTASFDTGAQFISAREPAFNHELIAAGATIWCHGFPILGKDSAADGHPRFRMPGGMNQLAKFFAKGLNIRDQLTVTGMQVTANRWQVTCTPGNLVKPGSIPNGSPVTLHADAVVLTAPAPQATNLLAGFDIAVPEVVKTIRYDPCLCLMLEYPTAPEALVPGSGGMQITDDLAIGWISSQRGKGLRTVGDGMVVHATGSWSTTQSGLSDAEILAQLRPLAEAALRRAGITDNADSCQLKKWKFSLPTVTISDSCLRVPAEAPLILAGDSFGNRPRVEGAWLSGCAAAESLA